MDVTYRIERQQLDPIPETEVLRYWLKEEMEEENNENLDPEAITEKDKLLSELIDRKPLAKSVFTERDRTWYRLILSEDELRGLEIVPGPDDEGWRAVAKGGLIESIAERILAADNLEQFDEMISKSLDKITGIAETVSGKDEFEELIIVGDKEGRPYIVDGNHRAVGIALHVLQTGEYIEQEAYVGVDDERMESSH